MLNAVFHLALSSLRYCIFASIQLRQTVTRLYAATGDLTTDIIIASILGNGLGILIVGKVGRGILILGIRILGTNILHLCYLYM